MWFVVYFSGVMTDQKCNFSLVCGNSSVQAKYMSYLLNLQLHLESTRGHSYHIVAQVSHGIWHKRNTFRQSS